MIDDEKEVGELLRDMEKQLPINVCPARELMQTLTRGGVACRPDEALEIESVLYLGDMGGIACGLKTWATAGKNAVVVSLSHLRIDDSHPLAGRIKAYQSRRAARIAMSGGTSERPRRGGKSRRRKR
jgi:hypothetical protein